MPTKTSNSKSTWSAKDIYDMIFSTYGNAHVNANKARAKEASKYMIPYIPEKEIMLTTGRYNTGKISTNLLDSIYNASQRTGVPLNITLGLAGRESTLGIGRGFKQGKSVSGTDLYSNWQQIQAIPNNEAQIKRWNSLLGRTDLTDEDYDFKSEFLIRAQDSLENTKQLDENPIDNALKFYQTGKYNPGDSRHTQMVEEDAKLLMSDPAIQKWLKTKTENQMKCGGRRKAQLGLAVTDGGTLTPIGPNMYLAQGRTHDDGGIGISYGKKYNAGGDLEIEDKEILQVVGGNTKFVGNGKFKSGSQEASIRVFSSVPFLRGASPAELVLGGANPDAVFKAQEEFKDRNRINDDGTTYEMGGEGTAKSKRSRPVTGILPYGYTIRNLYAVENPYRKGIRGNVAKMYDSRTLGAGVDVVSGHPELYKKAKSGKMTKKQADETAVIHLRKDDNAIRSNYADVYGKAAADTLSYGPRFLVAQARYQQGNVRKAWPAIHKAMAKGDAKALKKAVLQVTPKDHSYRRHWIEGFKVYKAGGIYIKPSKRGTFTAAATKHGMGVQEFASKVLANKENYSSAMVKKANFARNASRWKKEYGGSGNVLPEVVVTGKKPKTFFEKLDDYANISEKALAIPNLALSGASLISPNPITIGGAYLTSASGALLDLYQGGRALYKGDWFDAGKNAIDLGLSLIGLRALRNANKLNELDKALDASGATREYVRKSVGRGRGKRKATFTKEKNEAITQEAIGYGSIPASTAFSMLDTNKNKKEYGGSMLYTINGNVKNGLSLRPKATLGTKKEDEEKKKKNPNEVRYASRVKKGKAQEVTAKPVIEYNEAVDKNPDKYRYTRAAGFKNEVKTSSTGGGTQSKDGRWIGQYKTTNVGDWIGLGSNLAGSVASYFITKNAINKMSEPIKPVMAQAAKLKTRYNVEPQLSEIREAEQINRAVVRRNTQSSNTSLAREQRLMNEARGARNTLYGQKENIETQLINQDRLNRQSVMRDNVRAYNEYLNRLTATKMAQNEMRASNINNLISGLTGSVNSILSNIESRRATNNTLRAIAAANPNVDARLIGGFDYYIDPITKKKYNKNQQYVGTING